MPEAPLKIMMNVANPERAFDFGQLPNAGIGLARLEMIIAAHIGVHPNALLQYDRQDAATKKKIDEKSAGYADPVSFYVDRLDVRSEEHTSDYSHECASCMSPTV